MNTDKQLEQRCKHYGTTLTFCRCLGFQFRKKCKHNTYLNDKENDKVENIKIKDGEYTMKVINEHSEQIVDGMIRRGEIYEVKDKLFNLV